MKLNALTCKLWLLPEVTPLDSTSYFENRYIPSLALRIECMDWTIDDVIADVCLIWLSVNASG